MIQALLVLDMQIEIRHSFGANEVAAQREGKMGTSDQNTLQAGL